MAAPRDRPYVQFNFLVDLGNRDKGGAQAGFQEISGLGTDLAVSEYPSRDRKEKSARKITGLNTSTDITMKRGVIGSRDLSKWLDDIRSGSRDALRTITVTLMNEDHSKAVRSWSLRRARIVKHTSGPLNAKGTDVAMEELVLACERLESE